MKQVASASQSVDRSTPHAVLRAVLLMLLAGCVLAWGTAYKCSLYKSMETQKHTPVVKIDTRGSDIAKVQIEASSTPEPAPVPAVPAGTVQPEDRSRFWLLSEARPLLPASLRDLPLMAHRPPPAFDLASA